MTDGLSLWGEVPAWLPEDTFVPTAPQTAGIERYEADLSAQLTAKPRRLAHSLSVGLVAQRLACRYGADPFLARVAGILHDWSKAEPASGLIGRAHELGIDLGVDPSLVGPLLHGMVAARVLPSRYPELPREVWQAISRHTLGAADMTTLDACLFVADGIEPLRRSAPAIERQRAHVLTEGIAALYLESLSDGMAYVIESRRYLYPGTVAIYNAVVASGRRDKECE